MDAKRWKVVSLLLAVLLVFSLGMNFTNTASAERQPLMRRALTALQAAERNLARATPDKGGHRVKALEHTRKAIAQVKKGIRFDNKH